MIQLPYQFALEFTATDGKELGQRPVTPDFVPGIECLRCEMLRRHGRALPVPEDEVTVAPKWSPTAGAPHVDGIAFSANGDAVEVPNAMFRPAAQVQRRILMDDGTLEKDALCTYKVLAYAQTAPQASPRGRFSFSEELVPVPFVETNLDELFRRSTLMPSGADGERAEAALHVFVPERITDEILAQAQHAGAVETGGNLIGLLHRDPERKALAVEITAYVPARQTSATSISVSFQEATWEDLQAVIALRKDGSVHCGWSHSHPARHWCGEGCPLEKRLKCPRQLAFWSEDDRILHRTVFPMAWHIGLLANNADSGLTLSAFGWRRGCIQEIPFRILDATRPHGARATTPET